MQKWNLSHRHTGTFLSVTNASPSYTGWVYTWETTLVLKYCPLESLKMEGSRDRELRAERSDSLSSFLRILHSSEQGHTPVWTQPTQNKTKGISVHSSTKHTSVSTTGGQAPTLRSEESCCTFDRDSCTSAMGQLHSCSTMTPARLLAPVLAACGYLVWWQNQRRFDNSQLTSPQNIH